MQQNIEEHCTDDTADDSAPFAALAFKIVTDSFVGKLAFCMIFVTSGRIGENGGRSFYLIPLLPAMEHKKDLKVYIFLLKIIC